MSQGLENKDQEFEKYLQGKTDLSKTYAELPPVELPDHLDAAILAEAHRAVGSRPGARPKRNWAIPLSMVATVFVVVMAGLQLPYMLKEAELTKVSGEGKSAPMDTSMAEPVVEKNMAKRAPAAADERDNLRLMEREKSASISAELASMADKEEAPARPGVQVLAAPKTSAGMTGSVNAPAVQNMPESMAVTQPPPMAESRRAGGALMAAPAASKPLAPAEMEQGVVPAKEKKAIAPVENYTRDALEQGATAAPASQASGLLQDEATAASQRPQDWLARIKLLRQQGKLSDAKKELAAFKKRYPDYPVPSALEMK